jgi:hypothetical protein
VAGSALGRGGVADRLSGGGEEAHVTDLCGRNEAEELGDAPGWSPGSERGGPCEWSAGDRHRGGPHLRCQVAPSHFGRGTRAGVRRPQFLRQRRPPWGSDRSCRAIRIERWPMTYNGGMHRAQVGLSPRADSHACCRAGSRQPARSGRRGARDRRDRGRAATGPCAMRVPPGGNGKHARVCRPAHPANVLLAGDPVDDVLMNLPATRARGV